MSVYPKKELPFFILFTAGLCSFTALLALLTHQYPEPMAIIAKTVCPLTTGFLSSIFIKLFEKCVVNAISYKLDFVC